MWNRLSRFGWGLIAVITWPVWWVWWHLLLGVFGAPSVIQGWGVSAWHSFIGPHGYVAVVTLVGAYIGLYSLIEARHERRLNRATFERASFMSMATSENPATLRAAMSTFGDVQNVRIPVEPDWLASWTWKEEYQPNFDALRRWSYSFFRACTPEVCGEPIDLDHANLQDAHLFEARLQDAILTGANLQDAILAGAKLQDAHLTGANLQDAILAYADLLGVRGLTADQLCTVQTASQARLDEALEQQVKEQCPQILKEPQED